jgi:hypothetical protein
MRSVRSHRPHVDWPALSQTALVGVPTTCPHELESVPVAAVGRPGQRLGLQRIRTVCLQNGGRRESRSSVLLSEPGRAFGLQNRGAELKSEGHHRSILGQRRRPKAPWSLDLSDLDRGQPLDVERGIRPYHT